MRQSIRPVFSSDSLAPAPAQHRVFARRREWLAPILSIGCFVHCVGMALFAPLLPTAFAFLAGNELCERGLWLFSATLVSVGLWPQRSRLGGGLVVMWTVALVVGVVGLVLAQELTRQVSLLGLVMVQVCMLGKRVRAHRDICDRHVSGAACCSAGNAGDSLDSESNSR